MFGWGDSQDAHQQVYGDDSGNYDTKFSHELLAGAASFEGFKLFEDHQRNEGKTVSHAFAKEMLAGIVGGEIDKLAQKHGMEPGQHAEAKRRAQENAQRMYDEHYVQGQGADQYDPNQYSAPQQFNQY